MKFFGHVQDLYRAMAESPRRPKYVPIDTNNIERRYTYWLVYGMVHDYCNATQRLMAESAAEERALRNQYVNEMHDLLWECMTEGDYRLKQHSDAECAMIHEAIRVFKSRAESCK